MRDGRSDIRPGQVLRMRASADIIIAISPGNTQLHSVPHGGSCRLPVTCRESISLFGLRCRAGAITLNLILNEYKWYSSAPTRNQCAERGQLAELDLLSIDFGICNGDSRTHDLRMASHNTDTCSKIPACKLVHLFVHIRIHLHQYSFTQLFMVQLVKAWSTFSTDC